MNLTPNSSYDLFILFFISVIIIYSDTSTPAKLNNDHFHPKRGKSNRMGNWQRFAAFNQEHQSPISSPQRRNWNHGNVSKQNFYHRGKFVEN